MSWPPPTSTCFTTARRSSTAYINLQKLGSTKARFEQAIPVRKGGRDRLRVRLGNRDYGADATALAAVIKSPGGKVYDSAARLLAGQQPERPLELRLALARRQAPKAETFKPACPRGRTTRARWAA